MQKFIIGIVSSFIIVTLLRSKDVIVSRESVNKFSKIFKTVTSLDISQPTFTCSNLTTETPEQCAKSVQI